MNDTSKIVITDNLTAYIGQKMENVGTQTKYSEINRRIRENEKQMFSVCQSFNEQLLPLYSDMLFSTIQFLQPDS